MISGIPVLVPEQFRLQINLPEGAVDAEHSEYHMEQTPRVAELIRRNSGRLSLDVGCGKGTYSDCYSGDLVLADANFRFVEEAVDDCGAEKACLGVVADIRCIPFPDDVFDFVLASSVIEHVPTPQLELVWSGLKRVATVVQVDVPHESGLIRIVRAFLTSMRVYEREAYEDEVLRHHTDFSPANLEGEGFTVSGCIGWSSRKKIPVPLLWSVYDLAVRRLPIFAGTLIGLYKKQSPR